MKKLLLTAFAGCFAAVMLNAQATARENRNLRDFSEISYTISGTLSINIGQEFKVVIEGDRDDLRDVITEVNDGRLRIRRDNMRFGFRNDINVYVTMPRLTALSVSGSGDAVINDPLNEERLSFKVSGSGSIRTSEVTAGHMECEISGSGNIFTGTRGRTDNADIAISGSGNFTGESLIIGDLNVRISGSGRCICNVEKLLKAAISGSGDVIYSGNPGIDAHISGSGKVKSR